MTKTLQKILSAILTAWPSLPEAAAPSEEKNLIKH